MHVFDRPLITCFWEVFQKLKNKKATSAQPCTHFSQQSRKMKLENFYTKAKFNKLVPKIKIIQAVAPELKKC